MRLLPLMLLVCSFLNAQEIDWIDEDIPRSTSCCPQRPCARCCHKKRLEEYKNTPLIKNPYRLKTGDVIQLAIYGEEDTFQTVVVDPRGMITYLFLDPFPVAGKTLEELRIDLQQYLSGHWRYPVISINPVFFASDTYTVVGEVLQPGSFPLQGNPTVLSAIAKSGGFTTREYRDQLIDGVDLKRSFLSRNGDLVPIDFEKLVYNGDLSQNIPLESNDYLVFMENQIKQIFVLGEVYSPLAIGYFRTMSLAEAVAEAGGLTYDASSRVSVIRGSLSCPIHYLIDINRLLKGHACDFMLEPGDIVYVPPRRFTRLREIFRSAVRSFVSVAASIAGTKVYLRTNPRATNTVAPIPIIPLPTTNVLPQTQAATQ